MVSVKTTSADHRPPKLDLAQVMALAEEFQRVLSACGPIWPAGGAEEDRRPLPAAAARTMGVDHLDQFFEIAPQIAGLVPPWRPEWVEKALQRVERQLTRADHELTHLRSSLNRHQALLAKIGKKKAELKTLPAGAAGERSGLGGRRDRIGDASDSRVAALIRHEESVTRRLEETRSGLAGRERLKTRLLRIHAALFQAGNIWTELSRLLLFWPQACKELLGQVSAAGDRPVQDEIDPSTTHTADADGFPEAMVQRLAHLESITNHLIRAGQDLDRRARAFSAELDREVLEPDIAGGALRRKYQTASRHVETLAALGERLGRRREELASRWAELAESLAARQERHREWLTEHHHLIGQAVGAIRARATRRGALLMQVERRQRQLSQLAAALPGRLGRSGFLYRCLLSGALDLARARRELDRVKTELAAAHDRLIANPDQHVSCADEMLARVRVAQAQMATLTDTGAVLERLPRQLAAYRAVLIRAGRLSQMESAYRRRSTELERLRAEKDQLAATYREKQGELTRLWAEKNGLEAVIRRGQEELGELGGERKLLIQTARQRKEDLERLTQAHEHLRKAYQRRIEQLARLAEDKKRLADAHHRQAQALTELTDHNRRLADEHNLGQEQMADLAEARNRLEIEQRSHQDELLRLAEEKRHLEDEQARQRDELTRLAMEKNSLLRAYRQSQADLARLGRDKEQLDEELTRQRDELVRLATDRERLVQAQVGQERELARLAFDRESLIQVDQRRQTELERLAADRERLAQAQAQSQAELTRLATERQQLEALNTSQKKDLIRLAADQEALAQADEERQIHLERQAVERRDLEVAEARGREEVARLDLENRRLAETQSRQLEELTRLAQDRTRLIKEKNLLIRVLGRSRDQLGSLTRERNRLSEDLAAALVRTNSLEAHLNDEAYPLIQTLGVALYRAQILAGDQAGRLSETQERLLALQALSVQLDKGRREAEQTSQRLGVALAALGTDNDRRTRVFKEERDRLLAKTRAAAGRTRLMARDIEELTADHLESVHQTRRQAREIQELTGRLADLGPLLGFFMEQIQSFYGGGQPPVDLAAPAPVAWPEGSEFMILLIHILRQENEGLQAQLGAVREEHRDLEWRNQHLARSHQAMKERLEELLPVFSFLGAGWLKTTADLTEAQVERRLAAEQLSVVKARNRAHEKTLNELSSRLNQVEGDLTQTRESLEETRSDRDEAHRIEVELSTILAQVQMELAALRVERDRLTEALAEQASARAALARESQTWRQDNNRLAIEAQAYQREAVEWSAEVEDLKATLAGQKGQVEMAWSGLTLLASRSEEVLSRFQRELMAQARTIYDLERSLDDKSEQIGRLEQNQDRLALLFWTMARFGGGNPEVLDQLGRLTRDQGFTDAARIATARLGNLALGLVRGVAGERTRRLARRTARRGLYSLLLAGGLLFSLPEEAAVHTTLPDGLTRPREMVQLLQEKPINLDLATSRLFSPELGRPFDISFVSPWDKARGFDHVQAIITREIDALAAQVGLSTTDYLRVVRAAYPADRTVSLADLKDGRLTGILLGRQFPKVAGDIRGLALDKAETGTLYGLAAKGDIGLSHFWDRLYGDYRALKAGPRQSLDMVLNNAGNFLKHNGRVHQQEFAGCLSPIPEVEKMSLEEFTRVLGPFIRVNIQGHYSFPAQAYAPQSGPVVDYAERLTQDMYTAAKAMGVPLSFMVVITHHESHFANTLGDGNMSSSPFQIYQPTKPAIVRAMLDQGLQIPTVPDRLENYLTLATYMAAFHMSTLIERVSTPWAKDKPPLCDLDRVAYLYNGHEDYPAGVHQKKLALIGYLDRVKKQAGQKKDPDRS